MFLQLPYVTNTEDRTKSSVDALSIVRLPWSSLGGFAFKIPNHINVLEARALLVYVKLLVREGRAGQRVIVVVDAGVVKGAVRKFRSSSKGLNFVLRQLAGYCLGADLYLEILWVPTWANPGDAPSREVGLSVWRKKAEIAADISSGSLLAQDRYAEDAQRSHELGSEWAKYPQPELMTGCSLHPSSVHPRRQVVRRHVVQRARRECWGICCGNGGHAAAFSDHGLVGH